MCTLIQMDVCLTGSDLHYEIVQEYSDVDIKVRPHGQQFSYTTLYNKIVRHKMCRGHAKSCATNVHTTTIFYKFSATAT